jgi:hypothetical protein
LPLLGSFALLGGRPQWPSNTREQPQISATGASFKSDHSRPMVEGVTCLSPPNLPLLHPGMTLYSWCGLVHRSNGTPLGLLTSEHLFGSPRAGFYHDFPSHLNALHERTGGLLGDTRHVALRHTLLGYYLPFVPIDRSQEILNGVFHGSVTRLKFHLALPKSGVGADHPLKGCDRCFDADEAAGNHAFWRVEHQWPSVWVCRKHDLPLRVARYPHTPVHRRDWILPRSGPARDWFEVAIPSAARELLHRLAELSCTLAALDPSALFQQNIAHAYRVAVVEAGLTDGNGGANPKRLGKLLKQRYSVLAGVPGFELVASDHATAAVARSGLAADTAAGLHPLKHLLLIDTLFERWSTLQDVLAKLSADPATESRPAVVATIDPRHQRFAELVASGSSVTAAAHRIGVTATTGVRWAKVLEIPFTARPKTQKPTQVKESRRLLEAGLSKTAIAKATGIGSQSLNRLISSEPAVARAWREARLAKDRARHREGFKQLLKRNPGVPISAVRKIPGNGFHWLYRHDRDWLLKHLPAIWQQPNADDGF